eukprot:GDKK01029585.1.p1 GENE.GDKK01029585.1~~GDKK01029585.1.p1  ORF type:complete len:421 (-),score=67.91 GDKK01029585.1:7-1269(-)
MPKSDTIPMVDDQRLIVVRRDFLAPQSLSKWGHYHEQFATQFQHRFTLKKKQLNESIIVFKNHMRTAKYTALSWIPKSLFHQFHKVANIYFFFMCILTCMPFSPKSPTSMIGTFSVVMIFSILRDGYEDLQRHHEDSVANNTPIWRLCVTPSSLKSLSSSFFGSSTKALPTSVPPVEYLPKMEQTIWSHLCVGDIVFVSKNQAVPADLLVLTSSIEEGGIVFIDTMQLDGESSLKPRAPSTSIFKHLQDSKALFEECVSQIPSRVSSPSPGAHPLPPPPIPYSLQLALAALDLRLRTTPPQPSLTDFGASATIHSPLPSRADAQDPAKFLFDLWNNDQGKSSCRIPIGASTLADSDNLILRGSVVRNTSWIVGIVMYAGRESKLALNARPPPNKHSTSQRMLNKLVIYMLITLLSFSRVI